MKTKYPKMKKLLRISENDLKKWRKFINEKDSTDDPKIKLLEFQIPNETITLNDVPDPAKCDLGHFEAFALTFNAYYDKEIHENFLWISREYFYDGKHKNSIRYLRGILFFEQRAEHFVGPTNQEIYKKRLLKIVEDIRLLLQKNK